MTRSPAWNDDVALGVPTIENPASKATVTIVTGYFIANLPARGPRGPARTRRRFTCGRCLHKGTKRDMALMSPFAAVSLSRSGLDRDDDVAAGRGAAGVVVQRHLPQEQRARTRRLLVGADAGARVVRRDRVADGRRQIAGVARVEAVLVEVDAVAGVELAGRVRDGRRQVADSILADQDPADRVVPGRNVRQRRVDAAGALLADLQARVAGRIAIGRHVLHRRDDVAAAREVVVFLELEPFLQVAVRRAVVEVHAEVALVVLVEVEALFEVVVRCGVRDQTDDAPGVGLVDVEAVVEVGGILLPVSVEV